jgi:hypothetical protein
MAFSLQIIIAYSSSIDNLCFEQNRKTERQKDRETERQKDRKTEGQKDRQTDL